MWMQKAFWIFGMLASAQMLYSLPEESFLKNKCVRGVVPINEVFTHLPNECCNHKHNRKRKKHHHCRICPTGATGSPGATGAKGDPGSAGATGAPSTIPGPVGPQGLGGATGTTGDPGSTGATGDPGSTGATGDPGDPGATGVTGSNGNTGTTGGNGNTGVTGNNGNTGVTGGNGNTGATGNNGNTGATGNNGNTGATGSPGGTGASGVSNVFASYGMTGVTTVGATAAVPFNTIITQQGITSNGPPATMFTVSAGGFYLITYGILTNSGASFTLRRNGIAITGTTARSGATDDIGTWTGIILLSANDVITLVPTSGAVTLSQQDLVHNPNVAYISFTQIH